MAVAPFLPRSGTPYIPRPTLVIAAQSDAVLPATAIDVVISGVLHSGTIPAWDGDNDVTLRVFNSAGDRVAEARGVDMSGGFGNVAFPNVVVGPAGDYVIRAISTFGQIGSVVYRHTGQAP